MVTEYEKLMMELQRDNNDMLAVLIAEKLGAKSKGFTSAKFDTIDKVNSFLEKSNHD